MISYLHLLGYKEDPLELVENQKGTGRKREGKQAWVTMAILSCRHCAVMYFAEGRGGERYLVSWFFHCPSPSPSLRLWTLIPKYSHPPGISSYTGIHFTPFTYLLIRSFVYLLLFLPLRHHTGTRTLSFLDSRSFLNIYIYIYIFKYFRYHTLQYWKP